MIIGIGLDIVDLARFKIISQNLKFIEQYFSYSESKLNTLSLAGRFAAREALYKAIGGQSIFKFQDIEVINRENGSPKFVFKNEMARYFQSKKIHLTISHVPEYAISLVIIEAK
jgi:holo-[acyl-carrier protein] synthase